MMKESTLWSALTRQRFCRRRLDAAAWLESTQAWLRQVATYESGGKSPRSKQKRTTSRMNSDPRVLTTVYCLVSTAI